MSRLDATQPDGSVHVAEALIGDGDSLIHSARYDEGVRCYEQVVERFSGIDHSEIRRLVGRALARKASVFVSLGRSDEADAAYEELSAWLSRPGSVTTAVAARVALIRAQALNDAGLCDQAVVAASKSIALLEQDSPDRRPSIWVSALILKASALASTRRVHEAISLLDEIIGYYDQTGTGGSVRKGIARAWGKKADLLGSIGEYERAIGTYDELVSRFGDVAEDDLREVVADALRGMAGLLQEAGRYEQSLRIEEEIQKRFDGDPPTGRRYVVLDALIGQAWLQCKLHRTQEAIAIYDEVARRYGTEGELVVRTKVAAALASKAWILLDAGHTEETIGAVEDLVARFGQAVEPELLVHVLRGLIRKALALGELDRREEVISMVDVAVERFRDTTDTELHESIGQLMGLKALALRKLGDLEQSAALFGEVAEHYGDDGSPAMRGLVRHALTQRAEILAAAGQPAEAIVLSDALIMGIEDEAGPKERLADALGTKGMALIGEERYGEAIEVLDELIGSFEDDPEPALRRQVTIALANKVTALTGLDREDESAGVFQDMLTRFGEEALTMFDGTATYYANASDPQKREGLVSALYGKALALSKLDRQDEALATLNGLIARFEGDDTPAIQDVVSDARDAREEMRGEGE